MATNQNLFAGMNTQQQYSPLQMDDDDDGQKLGDLFDLGVGPSKSKGSTTASISSFQGSQGASMDPFSSMQSQQPKAPSAAPKQGANGSLFDEDDILGAICSSDPLATAAHQNRQAAQSQPQRTMTQSEAIFGQKQLRGTTPYGATNTASQLPTDIFAGIGGSSPFPEEEKKEDLQISANHYQENANRAASSSSAANAQGGMLSGLTSYFTGTPAPSSGENLPPGQFNSFGSDQINKNNKSWFQRWVFDFTTYSYMFETTTPLMVEKLRDAMWPFRPADQPNELNPANPEGHRRTSAFSPNEMYGPLWIMFTLIIQMLVLSHMAKTLQAQTGYGLTSQQSIADKLLVEQVIERYGGVGTLVFDPSTANANVALKSIMRVFFCVGSFFFFIPFGTYLLFMSSLEGKPRTYETSWKRFIQIYAYSMAAFIPCAVLLVVLMPWYRAKWLLVLATVAMASYYQYKESITTCKRYLSYSKYIKMSVAIVLLNLIFGLGLMTIITRA